MKLILSYLIVIVFSINAIAQEGNISGEITAFNTYGLAGVRVVAKKSGNEIQTDINGNFQIQCAKNDVLKVQAKGFVRQVIRLGDDNVLKINLIYMDSSSAFRSAVDAKHITEKDLAYAIENLMQENNDYSRYQSIFNLIQAISPLAKVVTNSGLTQVYLTSKGPTTINAGSEALLVVDDIITEDIASIVPAQVASVKVITGTESSMYGTRGGNGIIEIRLKH